MMRRLHQAKVVDNMGRANHKEMNDSHGVYECYIRSMLRILYEGSHQVAKCNVSEALLKTRQHRLWNGNDYTFPRGCGSENATKTQSSQALAHSETRIGNDHKWMRNFLNQLKLPPMESAEYFKRQVEVAFNVHVPIV